MNDKDNRFGITGKVIEISPVRTIGKNATQFRTLLLDDGAEKYPQQIEIEFSAGWTKQLEGLMPGQMVAVTFEVRGREWNGRHYVSLRGTTVTRCLEPAPEPEPVDPPTPQPVQDTLDGLPF